MQLIDQRGREPDKLGDLSLIALDPRAPRLVADRDELAVLLPRDERPLGSEDVLLPPHLTKIRARDAAPRLVGRLDLGETDAAVSVDADAVGCRKVTLLNDRVEKCG